jgi:lysyl-tRNA synthetase class 2
LRVVIDEEVGKREAELIAARRNNLAALRERGIDPFRATRFDVSAHAADLAKRYAGLANQEHAQAETHAIAGRLMASRGQGKVIFADVDDVSGRFQLYLKKDELGAAFDAFKELDRGDFIGARGFVFRSKMGELTLHVTSFEVLGKALAPLPDKWHGLTDVEKRYRQRYVDLAVNPHVREVFIARSKIVAEMRRFIDARGFFECETPVLLHIAGGAAARPFLTRSNALGDIPLTLRIATELNLKRLIVGGLERVYEIGRIFRNEGIDTTHNPEFTMLELYAAYWSVHEMMQFNEDMFAHLVRTVRGGDTLMYGENAISFATPFKRIGYLEALNEYAGLSRDQLLDAGGVQAILRDFGLPASPTHAHALDKIFERVVEPHLLEPTFVYGYPVVLSPLAKRMADDSELAERYELFGAHMELANAFTELNDPDDQRRRFNVQIAERSAGDEEVPPPDWDFVNALEIGMPPTAGIGVGVDRLVMLLTNNASIRDVILFPLQRPQH